MNETEKAEKVVRTFEDELEELKGRTSILEKQQQEVSYAARTGDKQAKVKLDKINAEISANSNEIKIVMSALVEAKSRLGTAEQVEARAADQAKAIKIQELQLAFVERLELIDEACKDIAKCTSENKILLSEMHRLGVTAPSHDSVRINSVLAIKTTNERRTFKWLAEQWGASIGNRIASRLPAKEDA